jgi:hypothetical protein
VVVAVAVVVVKVAHTVVGVDQNVMPPPLRLLVALLFSSHEQ